MFKESIRSLRLWFVVISLIELFIGLVGLGLLSDQEGLVGDLTLSTIPQIASFFWIISGLVDLYFGLMLSNYLNPTRARYVIFWLLSIFGISVLLSVGEIAQDPQALIELVGEGLITWYLVHNIHRLAGLHSKKN